MPDIKQIEVRVKVGGEVRMLFAELGQSLRELLLAKGVSPYRGTFKTLNCQGLGVCGSCRVKVKEGDQWWSRRSCQIRCFQSLEIELE